MGNENKLDKLIKERDTKSPDQAEAEKGTIMVVDDDSSIRRSLKSTLSDFNVITANDGKESIELFKKNDAILCVIMDALMPNMDGFEASKQIHKINPDIPIIMLTAYQDEHDISKVVDLGFEGYVTKGAIEITPEGDVIFPNLDDLRSKLKRACDNYSVLLKEKHFEHVSDPQLIEEIIQFSMEVEEQNRMPEDHSIAGYDEAKRYIAGTSYPENADYILFSMELDYIFGLKEKKILEFCTGPGDLSFVMSGYMPSQILALDASKEMITYAERKHINENLEFRLIDIFDLDGIDYNFDLVVCQNSMHHFNGKSLFDFFDAAYKCLKIGGSFYVSDYRKEEINDNILSQRLKATNKHVREDLMHTIQASYTRDELSLLLKEFGDRIKHEVFFPNQIFSYLKKRPGYKEIVANDPHPHHIDYDLSLRVKLTKLK